jgi:hypothetical protein
MSSVINEVKDAPETFTSWDKCMDKAYCKYVKQNHYGSVH